ncbi:MAG: DUF3293 domain-containing protein [Xanthomonadales bacterium]|nr:DUF3293 domain-containing protein [Xanthomonadales bacterium]
MSRDHLSATLLHAYANAHYEFCRDGRWIDCRLAQASSTAVVPALLSACNPASRELDARANRIRHQALCAELRAAHIAHWPARGRAPDASWIEASVLLHARLAIVDALARRYRQNAVWLPGPPPVLRLYVDPASALPAVVANVRLQWVGCDPPDPPEPT